MSFKRVLHCALPLVCVLVLLSCAREKDSSDAPIRVELKGGSACLDKFTEQIGDYFNEKTSSAEIGAFWNCVSDMITSYENITVGAGPNGDIYTARAVRSFLQRYFLKNNPLSDRLFGASMELKRVLLNGGTDTITRGELERLRAFIGVLRSISIQLQPHVGVLFGHRALAGDQEIADAQAAFALALNQVGTWIAENRQPYTFAQLQVFVDEVGKWTHQDAEADQVFGKIQRAMTILPSAKKILIGGDTRGVGAGEWRELFSVLGRGYSLYLGVNFGATPDLNSGLARKVIPSALKQVVAVLKTSIASHEHGTIPMSEWNSFFADLETSKLLPEAFKASALSDLWTWTIKRLLGGPAQANGLTAANLSALERRLDLWLDLWNQTASETETGGFNGVLNASEPMSWDARGRLQIPSAQSRWTEPSRKMMIWPYVLIDWVKDAYVGADADRMTEANMTVAVKEILPLLQAFGWLKSTKTTIGTRLLREADLFMPSSNGDGFLDVHEATRYLAYVASSFRSAQVWLNEARTACPDSNPVCVRGLAVTPHSEVLNGLSHLKRASRRQSPDQFARYMQQAEETILDQVQTRPFSTGDLLQVWCLFQYVETFQLRFDVDRTELITLPEGMAAYQIYGGTLQRMLKKYGLSDDQVLAFFTFLMKYGDTPFGMFGGQVIFLNWQWHRDSWAFSADRSVLMSILNQLHKL